MSKAMEFEHDSEGSNSFLDVITSCIGILIILVIVSGQHARQLAEAMVSAPKQAAVADAQAQEMRIDQEVRDIAWQRQRVELELAQKANERGQLSTLVAAIEEDMGKRRAALDEKARSHYDHERDLALARNELDKLDAERQQAEKASEAKTIKIESYPTPIGKTVDTKEVHFQLSGGRLAFLPYETLLDRLKSSLRDVIMRMHDQSEIVDTMGPVEGFRMRFVIQRQEAPQGSLFQVAYIEFIPVSGQLGETMDEAMRPGSKFLETLNMMAPREYTVTVWTYPDSFDAFRRLKKTLYGMGYSVAARPLPAGFPIGASPSGSKSSAE